MIDVKKVAHLARLTITENEEKTFQEQLSSILKYFEMLSKVNTQGVESLITPTDMELKLREDQVESWRDAEAALANAPERSGNLFKVPPVV